VETITRRRFIRQGAAALAAAGLTGLGPGLVRAAAGPAVREFRLRAEPARINLGAGPEFTAWTYNGRTPGPEIRVKEGETIRVVLENGLPEPTTIHWHGLPVPNAMDGVPGLTQAPVGPGESFVYEFPARPAGTYLYHSHARYQLDRGLYGPLIVEPRGSVRGHDREFTLVLEDWARVDGGGPEAARRRPPGAHGPMGRRMGRGMGRGMMAGPMMGRPGGFAGGPLTEPWYDAYAVNGRVFPEVEPLVVNRGDLVLLRLINASSSTIFDLALAGHDLTVTHLDGRPVRPITTEVVRIGMGERYDLEFVADNPGAWLLAANELGFGESGLKVPLLYRSNRERTPVRPVFRPGMVLAGYREMESLEPWGPLPEEGWRGFRQVLGGGMHSPYWTINGRVHPDSEGLLVEAGERIRLGYLNRSPMPHPMHLHGHFFRLVNPDLDRERWLVKDTIIVEPMERLEVELLADNPGRWFHHCHNLYHMEAGMANVMAYREGSLRSSAPGRPREEA